MRVLAIMLLTASGAGAQMLDLGDRPPRPTTSVAATALRARLDTAISNHPQRTDREQARRALRSLARHLVQRGLDAGDRGAIHMLLAQTITLNLASLDALIADESTITDAEVALLLHDLAITDRDLSIDASDLDRRLQDTFAQVLDDMPAGVTAWLEAPPIDPAQALPDAWLDTIVTRGISEDAAAGVLVIRDDLRDALRWPSYAPEAARLERTIRGSTGVLDPAFGWVTPVYRESMIRSLEESLGDLGADYKRADALRSLERWRVAAEAFALANDLPPGPHARQAQDALVMVATSTNAQAPGPLRRMSDFVRVLMLLREGESAPGGDSIIRSFRPVHRVASEQLERSTDRLVRSLAAILQRDDAMADPGVLAAISTHRRAVEDLMAIVRISDAFADRSLSPDGTMVRVDRRLLADQLMRTLRSTEDPQVALGLTSDMAAQVERYESLPGEAALRDAVARAGAGTLSGVAQIWADATGFRQNELLAKLERERQAWWTEWSRDFEIGDQPTEFHTLDAMRMLVETIWWAQIVNAAAFGAAPDGPVSTPLQAWPGFEMSAGALRAIAPSPEMFSEAARLIVADRPGDAMDVIRAIVDEHPVFVAVARLELEAARRGAARPTVLHELCTGGPPPTWHADQAWMADRRFDLAELCRYAEELAALEALDDTSRAEGVRAYLNDIARMIIRDLDAGG